MGAQRADTMAEKGEEEPLAVATRAGALEAAAALAESVAAHLEESWAAGALEVGPGVEAAKAVAREVEAAEVVARPEAARVAVPKVASGAPREAATAA